jgi:hypothetical protein
MSEDPDFLQRRALVTGAAVLGAGVAAALPSPGRAQPAAWRPARHALDDWMDLPGEHRLVFDCTMPAGAADALIFAGTYYRTNLESYGLGPASLAVVFIFRHQATAFGYNDAIWAKYGAPLGEIMKLVDPATQKAPLRNLYDVKDSAGMRATLSDMRAKGAHFAVCGAATQFLSQGLAKATGGKPEAIHAELAANLIPNAHLVAAGIVAVNRTQERGFALAYTG